jgi:hypothetical protein
MIFFGGTFARRLKNNKNASTMYWSMEHEKPKTHTLT